MPTSSSISSSDESTDDPVRSGFIKRLFLSVLPAAVGALSLIGFGFISGEFLPTHIVAWLQTLGQPIIYLPRYTDRTFSYKIAGIEIRRPEVVALGPSRANQWRDAMFGVSFYNAAQATYTFADYAEFLRKSSFDPRVMIVSIDFYNFSVQWGEQYQHRLKDDLSLVDVSSLPIGKFLKELASIPLGVFDDLRDPVYGVAAIGLSAQHLGFGFRNDGSVQYGEQISGNLDLERVRATQLERVSRGESIFAFHDKLDERAFDDLADFLNVAASRGVKIIGVTMPYDPVVVDALDQSPKHRSWQLFRDGHVRKWLADRDVLYFDFTEIQSFDGQSDEFIDTFHASEPAYVRILIEMAKDPRVRDLLQVDVPELQRWLVAANELEVFRNYFADQMD